MIRDGVTGSAGPVAESEADTVGLGGCVRSLPVWGACSGGRHVMCPLLLM